ncbi:MAG TPA: PatB family C-S lyase [Clostridia bacterium]|nr:PatB family C-S lyase [Clostridia bacterium]
MKKVDESFFDRVVDRHGTCSIKWDLYGSKLLPMWVADMDFASPEEVTQALCERAAHPVYGYTEIDFEAYTKPMLDWWKSRHGLTVERDQVYYLPGVVSGLYLALRAFTQPGDGVVIQTPVYGPFFHAVENSKRTLLENPLIRDESGWRMDLEGLRRCFEQGARMMILCSPHNPIGRVWTRLELEALVALCAEFDVLMACDEIHADFVYPGHPHLPLLSLPGARERAIALQAPSKTFNIAGLQIASAFIQDPALGERFCRETLESGAASGNLFGLEGMRAAYACGGPWLDALLRYLDRSRGMIASFLSERMPRVRFDRVEGTYLTLLDFRAYGLDEKGLRARLEVPGGVALSAGSGFGAPGCMRLNFGCPHTQLQEALERLERCLKDA